MTVCVLDASVVARWFLAPDPASQRLLNEYEAGRLSIHAPELLLEEVGNALWKAVGFGNLPAANARAAMRHLLEYELTLHPHALFIEAALALALEHRFTVYDATYVAIAVRLDLPLHTADRKLHRVASSLVRSVLVG